MVTRIVLAVVAASLILAGCSTAGEGDRVGAPSDPTTARVPSDITTTPVVEPTRTADPPPPPSPKPAPVEPDPRWVFFTDDRTPRSSPWFRGRHPVMIPFGCTPAPYYDPDPACPGGQGFHHGIDVAMPCGTPLRAGRAGRVLDNAGLGGAYGDSPVLLRTGTQDVVIGHTRRVLVTPGERVRRGQRFALAGDAGAPDGCHLHFEVRPAGGSYRQAVDPAPLLGLS